MGRVSLSSARRGNRGNERRGLQRLSSTADRPHRIEFKPVREGRTAPLGKHLGRRDAARRSSTADDKPGVTKVSTVPVIRQLIALATLRRGASARLRSQRTRLQARSCR